MTTSVADHLTDLDDAVELDFIRSRSGRVHVEQWWEDPPGVWMSSSDYAFDHARTKARVRRRRPKPPRPRRPWWAYAIYGVIATIGYVVSGHFRSWWLAGIDAACILALVPLTRLAVRWWLWERQEGLPHARLTTPGWAVLGGTVGLVALMLLKLRFQWGGGW